ncbi:3-methyladenine DNA glycosylase AlkD [Sphingomonas naasensis]|uniref:DNA alkylation repair protein n=1 Tax=Sphingomonas naasensis TaxID=1344951 RepID=A0A4S1WMI5_9SPHN|nr:DNA alkylation repair protein [Sphingomonas naasensis]NIJ20390.1 3-methyladenine DNA glycosylase AlkD [Sphingomonas naasensis]TGX44498.1 DNA alkylation repair protein [Sphingomonas naasensis]
MTADIAPVLRALEAHAEAAVRDAMGPRFGIVTADRVLGVRMANIQAVAKPLGRDSALAEALWQSGVYEARMAACMIDDPATVTPERMDRWRADLDNWAVTDTACFKLWDRTPHAFAAIDRWSSLNDEFGRRAAFALLASCAVHRKGTDADYLARLPLIAAASGDARNFVKKGVNWALRAIGGRQSPTLRAAARDCAARLAASPDKTARWIGKDALREFTRADAKNATKA